MIFGIEMGSEVGLKVSYNNWLRRPWASFAAVGEGLGLIDFMMPLREALMLLGERVSGPHYSRTISQSWSGV